MTACPTLPSLNEANLLILHRKVLAKLLEEDKDLLAEIDTSAVLDILNRLPLRSLPEFLYKYFVSIVSRVSVDFAVIFKILVECPEVSKRNDIRKMFPLHFIMTLPFDQPACRALLGLLLKQNPSVLCEKNEEGDTPLHVYLTQNSPDPAVIAAILSAAPRAARCATAVSERLPLHLSLKYFQHGKLHFECIKLLVKAYPEAAMMQARDEVRRLNLFTDITTCAVVEWTPMQRALNSNHTELHALMARELHHRGVRRLNSILCPLRH